MERQDFTLTISGGSVFIFDGAILRAHYKSSDTRKTPLSSMVDWLLSKESDKAAVEVDLEGYGEALKKYAEEVWKQDKPLSYFTNKLREDFSKETRAMYNLMYPSDPDLVAIIGSLLSAGDLQ